MVRLLNKLHRKLLTPVYRQIESLRDEAEHNRMLIVQPRIREFASLSALPQLAEAEFSVFSQWGEDGIIQYLLSKTEIPEQSFIEFGVQDYRESNTRFLLMNNNWRGLIIDAGRHYIDYIRNQDYYWRHNLTALCSFITRSNINSLFTQAGLVGDIGLLSIDIDGNDYWIWEAITVVSPRIVVIEYNGLFGPRLPVSVPYDDYFQRTQAHYSNIYFGASLKALCFLAQRKGYSFVGSNSAGSNAFFVRNDVAGALPSLTCEEGYIESRVRESRDQQGHLTFLSGAERHKLIVDQQVINVETNTKIRVGDCI